MTFALRPLTPGDIERAVEIIEETNPEPTLTDIGDIFRATITLSFKPELYNMAPRFIGADVDGQLQSVAGYAWSSFAAEIWEFCWGSVATTYQGRGIGDTMIKFRFEEIKKRVTTDQAFVVVHTHPTSLYLKNGFEQTLQMGAAGKSLLTKRLK